MRRRRCGSGPACRINFGCGGSSSDSGCATARRQLFTAVFAVELFINMYANWFRTFIRNGWNWCESRGNACLGAPSRLSGYCKGVLV